MGALYELARPKHFDQYHGQDAAVALLRKAFGGKTHWKGVLICGPSGAGKTTLARILAVSVNTKSFGVYDPKDYSKLMGDIDYTEVNAADFNGVDAMRGFARMGDLLPAAGKKRVIVLDEAHQITSAAQNALLKPLEDGPESTLWILLTTAPDKILKTVKQRCLTVVLRAPDEDAIKRIIMDAKAHLDTPPDNTKKLRQFLARGAYSGRQIVTALERYAAGSKTFDTTDPTEEIPSIEVCRALMAGDWPKIQRAVAGTSADALRQLRMAVLGYLRAVANNPRTESRMMLALLQVVRSMTGLPPYEDPAYAAWFTLVLWEAAQTLRKARG